MDILAQNVRRWRIARKISQQALANLIGIEYSQISRIERAVMNTSISVVFAIAKALNVPPAELLQTKE